MDPVIASREASQLVVIAKGVLNLQNAIKEMFGKSHPVFWNFHLSMHTHLNNINRDDPRYKRVAYLLAKINANDMLQSAETAMWSYKQTEIEAEKQKFEFEKTTPSALHQFAERDGYQFFERAPDPSKNLLSDDVTLEEFKKVSNDSSCFVDDSFCLKSLLKLHGLGKKKYIPAQEYEEFKEWKSDKDFEKAFIEAGKQLGELSNSEVHRDKWVEIWAGRDREDEVKMKLWDEYYQSVKDNKPDSK